MMLKTSDEARNNRLQFYYRIGFIKTNIRQIHRRNLTIKACYITKKMTPPPCEISITVDTLATVYKKFCET